jgi:2-polyprenyl-3-methyl-5-hydroxy-6-metoxy-1,4-benzoquinol methylase
MNYQHRNLRYEVRTAENIPENEKFDAIVCSEVLEHLYDPSQVVKNFDGILAPNGIIVVTVPNGKGPRESFVTRPAQNAMKKKNFRYRMMIFVKRMLGYSGNTIHSSNPDLEHVQFFSKKDLQQLAGKHGFQITVFSAANFLEKVFPFSIVCRFISALQRFDCWVADMIPITWASGFNTVWKRK